MVALSTLLMTLLIGFMVFPDVARASDFDTETSALVNTYTCTINGVERTLLVYEDGCIYLKVGVDYPTALAPDFPPLRKIIFKEYDDPQKVFEKKYK